MTEIIIILGGLSDPKAQKSAEHTRIKLQNLTGINLFMRLSTICFRASDVREGLQCFVFLIIENVKKTSR